MVEGGDHHHEEAKIINLRSISGDDHTAISVSMPMEDLGVDWRGRPCKPHKHGGMKAAIFVLGLTLISSSLHTYRCHVFIYIVGLNIEYM